MDSRIHLLGPENLREGRKKKKKKAKEFGI